MKDRRPAPAGDGGTSVPIAAAALATLIAASRFFARQKTFWEWDDFIFGLSLHRFAPQGGVPQAPFYPGFVALGRLARHFSGADVGALTLVSAVSSCLAALAVFGIAREILGSARAGAAAAAIFSFLPPVWFHAGAPLSDDAGLAASLGALWAALAARRRPALLPAAAVLFGAAVSIRPQDAIVAVPALLFAPSPRKRIATAAGAVAAAVIFYAVPVAWAAGGLVPAVRIFRRQAGYVLSTDSVLAARRGLGVSVRRYLLGMWGYPAFGIAVIALSVLGALLLLRAGRKRELAVLAASFLPYAALCVLFLDPTVAARYALPALPLAAILAAVAAAAIEHRVRRALPVVTAAVVAGGAAIAAPAVAVMHARPSPPVEAAAGVLAGAGGGPFAVLRPAGLYVAAELLFPGIPKLDAETTSDSTLAASSVPVWRYGVSAFDTEIAAWPPFRTFSTVGRGRYLLVAFGRWKRQPEFSGGWFGEETEGTEFFRWMGRRGEIRFPPSVDVRSILLTVVTTPKSFPRPPVVAVAWNGSVCARRPLVDPRTLMSCRILPPGSPGGVLVLSSDETFNPKRSGRSGDDRDLSLELRALRWSAR